MIDNTIITDLIKQKVQVLVVTSHGELLESDNHLFNASQIKSIGEIHPFFEGIAPLLETIDKRISFPCVNLIIDKKEFILDVVLVIENKSTYILLFDFSEHYRESHTLTQEKNEASIERFKLFFEHQLLTEKQKFKNDFIANLNHEIRNPLNNLLGFVEILARTNLDYEQQETLKVVQSTGSQLKELMDDLLDIAKIERGIMSKKDIPFNLKLFLKDLQSHFSKKYLHSSITCALAIADNVPTTLYGDPTRMYQIFFNLIDNAYKNNEEGVIHVNVTLVSKKEDFVIINFQISDTGKGMSKEDLSHVFDSYFQIQMEQLKPVGEGLGLKIVKDFVNLLEGTVSAVSTQNQGTTFTVQLPFRIRKKAKRRTVPKGSGLVISKRILIVENDELNQVLFMKTFLNNEKGYHIEIVKNGNATLERIKQKKYSLIILKAEYDDMTAVQILEKLTRPKKDTLNKIPVLMVSGHTLQDEQDAFIKAGASAFLTKPYTQKELFKSIEKLLH
jgi:signal transduction histidine kinase/CheY-like chemotaxis protein